MRSNNKKKSKSKSRTFRISMIYILSGLVIILLFMLCFCSINLVGYGKKYFTVESRVDKVKSAQQKDNEIAKTVGWIKVQGTNIDYPVYYAPGSDYSSITVDFAWTEADFKTLNNIVYISGHNIKNLSSEPLIADKSHTRFEQLMSFSDYDFAKDNQYIQYTFNGVDYVYKIFSVSYESYLHFDNYNTESYTSEKMKKYLDEIKKDSIYDYDVSANENDKVISLDTCTRMFKDDRYVHLRVVGRLLRDGEKMNKGKVSINKNYTEIKNIVRGGDSYDEA